MGFPPGGRSASSGGRGRGRGGSPASSSRRGREASSTRGGGSRGAGAPRGMARGGGRGGGRGSQRDRSAPASKGARSGSSTGYQKDYRPGESRGRSYGRGRGGERGRGRGGRGGGASAEVVDSQPLIDLSQAALVAMEIQSRISQFKNKLQNFSLGKGMDEVMRFVPPQFIALHLPLEVAPYRSYLSKFQRGTDENYVVGFLKWHEWASYEVNKDKSFGSEKYGARKATASTEEDAADAVEEADAVSKEASPEGRSKRFSASRAALAEKAREREHVRALLQMCLRHNSARRKEGQHALLNHLKSHLADGPERINSLEDLRDTTHHTVEYALARLLMGMATDDVAMVFLNCHALYLVLKETSISPAVLLALMSEELAMEARAKAMLQRMEAAKKGADEGTEANDADIDPDDLNDPTKGERNQRMGAAVFAMSAIMASGKPLSRGDVRCLVEYLSATFIEQKGIRVLTGNVLLQLLRLYGEAALTDSTCWMWMSYAFFHYPKLEYYRPEAIQLLILLMHSKQTGKPTPRSEWLQPTLKNYIDMDPLEPSTLEQLANALFRKEQVVSMHPLPHPVWNDLFAIVVERCNAGESLRQHLSSIMHNVITPYRRGNSDSPRRALFQHLVTRLGQLAFQHDDAVERVEIVKLANEVVGYGKQNVTVGKPSDVSQLRYLSIDEMEQKVKSLIVQIGLISDNQAGAAASRAWTLRELRTCLLVPLREGTEAPYVNAAAMALLKHGFFPPPYTDELNKNRAIYIFSDVFSFTFQSATGGMSRPKCSLDPLAVITAYLAAEEAKKVRFTTAVNHSKFRKARNRIIEVLDTTNTSRSVLFYKSRDVQVLLTLLFLMLSVDDPLNDEAVNLATSVVPDLARFYQEGTIEAIELLYDVLMALLMRKSMPMHIIPIMTSVRRIATGFLIKFSRFVRERAAVDLVLAPLRDAFNTDSREAVRQSRSRKGKAAEADSDEEAEGDDEGGDESSETSSNDAERPQRLARKGRASARGKGSEGVDNDDLDEHDEEERESGDEENEEESETATEATEEDEDDSNDEEVHRDDTSEGGEVASEEDIDDDDDDMEVLGEEEAPPEQYLQSLKKMIGSDEVGFVYPSDTESKEKAAVVRSIRVAARFGLSLRSPIVVDVFQVLLAVIRENLKANDDVIFNACLAAVEMLLLTKNRYYGSFCGAEELFQILGDIQSYCRKVERSLVNKEHSGKAKENARIRYRLQKLKQLSLTVVHFIAFLAYKNHADDEVRITIAEYYKSLFYDRGWDAKRRIGGLKRDLYHYRHGFAWAILPGVVERAQELQAIEGAQRMRVFHGCCDLIEAVLPRISGLPQALKASVTAVIRDFFSFMTLHEIFDTKHTLLYNYFHCLKFAFEYNSKVGLDVEWVSRVVDEAIDDDALQVSSATIRILVTLERLLGKTPRAKAIKAPTPVKLLHEQYLRPEANGRATGKKAESATTGKGGDEHLLPNAVRLRQMKAEGSRKAKRVREKVVKSLLSYRNDESTDAERAQKRLRREEAKIKDRLERQLLRETRNKNMTKEEKEERRRRINMAKQDRIARNRERKRMLHQKRQQAFDRWRMEKLASIGTE